jgi:hypothetical protein
LKPNHGGHVVRVLGSGAMSQHSRVASRERYGGFRLTGVSIAKAIDRQLLQFELPCRVVVDCVKRCSQGGCIVYASDRHMGEEDRRAVQCRANNPVYRASCSAIRSSLPRVTLAKSHVF